MVMEILMIYVPCKNLEGASKLIQTLLDQKLIACGNVIGAQSFYTWQGEFCEEGEHVAIMKTSIDLEYEVESAIVAHHEYDVPCIARWIINVNDAYGDWVKSQTIPS